MKSRILIIGFGDMAERIGVLLAASNKISDIIIASRNSARGDTAARLLGASFPCRIAFRQLDATNQKEVEQVITDVSPDLILQNASLIGPFVLNGRDDPVAHVFGRVGRGPTLPAQLPVLLAVMKAVRAVGYDRPVANLSLPDVTNPILAAIGLAPTVGLGNASMVQYRVRQAFLLQDGVKKEDVPLIRIVAHHAQVPIAMQSLMPEDPTNRCRVYLGEEGVRNDQLAYMAPAIAAGPHYNLPTAACCVDALLALLPGAAPLRISLPAPFGLPGGYPVLLQDGGVELDLPVTATMEDCIEFQRRMARADGIENIDDDGTVTFTHEVVSALSVIDPRLCEPLRLSQLPERFDILRDSLEI